VSAVTDDDSEIEASRAPLLDHLTELRSRLIVCAIAVFLAFIGCFIYSTEVYLFLTRPLAMASALMAQEHLHAGPFELVQAVTGLKHVPTTPVVMQATAPLEFFFTKMKLALFAAVVIAFPILAWQLYRFVAPGLYRRERRAFLPFLLASPVLFLMGAALVYYFLLPFLMWFSLNQNIQTPDIKVSLIPKVSDYLDLVTKLLLAFCLCFQLPVILSLLGMAGLIGSKLLAKTRRYALVGILLVSAVVTPPDMISPFMLAIPIYLLYEVSILCVSLIERGRKDTAAA